jgi:hypothetical protein
MGAYRRAYVAWVSVAIHVLACLALMAAAGGTELVSEMGDRQSWVLQHTALWVVTWLLWALASMSLLAFCCVWAGRLLELRAPRTPVLLSCFVIAVGVAFDLCGETLNMTWLTDPARSLADFAWGARAYNVLSVAVANGLYCIAGLWLSALSWRAGFLRGSVGVLGVTMWLVGLALTGMALVEFGPGIIVTGGLVMALYIPWATLVGWRLRPHS